jgi:hypothetical protein
MSKLSWSLTIVVLAVLCVPAATSAADWYAVTPAGGLTAETASSGSAPMIDVTASDLETLRVTAAAMGLSLETVQGDHGQFVRLSWPDAAPFGELGAPALPAIRRLFIAPYGAEISWQAEVGQAYTLDSGAVGQPLSIYPVQLPVPKVPGAVENAVFQIDPQAYTVDAALPAERVHVEELGLIRGQRLCLLEIRPVAYNAAQQTVTFYPDIAATIRFAGSRVPADECSALPGLRGAVLNPELLPAEQRGTGKYIIVVASTLESAIASFASAKTAQGYTVTTHPVTAGTTNAQIKTYIQGLWNNPGTRPDFILLVGDSGAIPHWVGVGADSPATDLQYVCMDGASDWYPDIPIGRFAVADATQLGNVVDKTLYYETGPLADPGYLMRAVFMASSDNYTVSEGTHNWCINNYMTPLGYTSDKLYCHTYSATPQQVRNAFNNGRFFGIYSGHGAETYWADGPVFYPADVNGLTNQNMYAFVCSFSCLTGSFTTAECFMETWSRAVHKGAAVAFGSSVTSYWTEDDILQKVLFDAIFDANSPQPTRVGPVVIDAKMRYLGHFGSGGSTRRYFEMYNTFGDPSFPFGGPDVPPHGMQASPGGAFASSGPHGGPFTPNSVTYTLKNFDTWDIPYTVTKTAGWLTITNGTGTIPAGGQATVTVTINGFANGLGNGPHTDTLAFANNYNHDGDTTRPVTLTIGVPTMQFSWPLDISPVWTISGGQWAFGHPTGGGGAYGAHDPNNGHTGTNVYGYNLAGDYANSIPEYHLTTTAINCSTLTNVRLKFWRWLGVEQPAYDHAYIRVSNNGTTWTTVWQNDAEVADSSWQAQDYDISAVADNQASVYVRWTMGTTDGSWTYCGWNIDDVEIWGLAPTLPDVLGDMNCDGIVSFDDINPFVLAISDAEAYFAAFPNCNILRADCNGDGLVDFDDINPFVALLSN